MKIMRTSWDEARKEEKIMVAKSWDEVNEEDEMKLAGTLKDCVKSEGHGKNVLEWGETKRRRIRRRITENDRNVLRWGEDGRRSGNSGKAWEVLKRDEGEGAVGASVNLRAISDYHMSLLSVHIYFNHALITQLLFLCLSKNVIAIALSGVTV